MWVPDFTPLFDVAVLAIFYGFPIGFGLVLSLAITLIVVPGWWIVIPPALGALLGWIGKKIILDR